MCVHYLHVNEVQNISNLLMNINLNFMNHLVEGGGMSIKVFADGANIEGMLDM